MNTIIISWRKDENSPIQSKSYTKSEEATKARNWLVKNGAVDVDMAVRVVKPLHKLDE